MEAKKATTKASRPKTAKVTRPKPGVTHLAGIPCMNGKSKPVVDANYSYNRANVTCEECLGKKQI